MLRFTEALVSAGHEIGLVFFYQEGVRSAAKDENQNDRWLHFANEHEIPLAVCIGAAARRGLVDESEPEASDQVKPGFEIVGLGQYVGAMVDADRLVTFAGGS